jgi:hypothetical protein
MKIFTLTLLLSVLPIAQSAAPRDVSSCVEVGAASFWGVAGWNHFVYLSNRCGEPVSCTVTTSVDPDPHGVTLAKDQTEQAITAMSSPARVFVPRAMCE